MERRTDLLQRHAGFDIDTVVPMVQLRGAGADLKQDNTLAPLSIGHRAHPLLDSVKSQRRPRKGVCHGRQTMLKNWCPKIHAVDSAT
jgi:hypothetical protein